MIQESQPRIQIVVRKHTDPNKVHRSSRQSHQETKKNKGYIESPSPKSKVHTHRSENTVADASAVTSSAAKEDTESRRPPA